MSIVENILQDTHVSLVPRNAALIKKGGLNDWSKQEDCMAAVPTLVCQGPSFHLNSFC